PVPGPLSPGGWRAAWDVRLRPGFRRCRLATPRAGAGPRRTQDEGPVTRSEERELLMARAAERRGRDRPGVLIEPGAPAGGTEDARDQLGQVSLAAHPDAEPRLVEPAAPSRTDAVQDLVLAVGVVLLQPVVEQPGDGHGEANQPVARVAGAGLGRSPEDRRDLVLGQPGDHRRDHHADRDA